MRNCRPALARWLCEAGHEAVHVEEVGLRNSNDDALWTHALQNDAAIMTKDEDFAARSERNSAAYTADRVAARGKRDQPRAAHLD